MVELGCIKNVDPRSVWPNEAGDFTPWLAEHADLLGEALGLEIEIEQREASVGAFSLDLLGREVGSNRVVIVENQLERTDHNHLGQLLAYAGGLDARIIVWVSSEVRDEHRDAIHWLNEQTTDAVAFFAVELEVWKIGESLPAPHFNVVAHPSNFQRQIVRKTSTVPSRRGEMYQEFFEDLVSRLRDAHPNFTGRRVIRPESWIGFRSGHGGFSVNVGFASGSRFRVELYIDLGSRSGHSSRAELNKAAFDHLQIDGKSIEHELGESLEWERLDDRLASRVAAYRNGNIESSTAEQLDELKRWAVDLLPRFRDAFAPRIAALDLDALAAEAYEYEEAEA